MEDLNQSEELLNFFKALADANRLKIVGLLAQRPYSVRSLAEALGLAVSTTSHHLSMLSSAGLVSAKVDGHYYIYALQTDVLQKKAQHLLTHEALAKPIQEDADLDDFERKVMATFVDKDGRITAFPVQDKKYQVLLRYVLKAFEPGVRYTEKQVKEILGRYNPDFATLRRSLVDTRLMEREGGGGVYWRVE